MSQKKLKSFQEGSFKRMALAQQLEILEGISLGVVWLNAQAKVAYMNAAASEILQRSLKQSFGLPWKAIAPSLAEMIDKIEEEKVTVHEHALLLPDGTKLRVSASMMPYEVSEQTGWLIELFNIERHQRIVEEDERYHQYEAGSMLVKTLAHEVKNPLAGIYGATQLLERKLAKVKELEGVERFTSVILTEVKRLRNLVDRMLGPKNRGHYEPHNIHALIHYVLEVVAPDKPEKVAIKLDYDPSIPEVTMDFESMVQALMNIVLNAYQAMEKHGGILTLQTRIERKFTLGSETHPLVAVIKVIDEGEGVDPKMFDAIFYPMVSTKSSGTGLGLSVSQNIVRQHGGLIVAESEPGHTVFKIYLPLSQPKQSEAKRRGEESKNDDGKREDTSRNAGDLDCG